MMSLPVTEDHERPACIRCGSSHVVRNGHGNGHRRFLCHGCGRSFGPTTNPDSGGVRLAEKHAAFLELCHEPLPLRALAEKVGVALSTAFRWRHQYLQRLEQESRKPVVQGPVIVLFSTITSGKPVGEGDIPVDTEPPIARFPGLVPTGYRAGTVTHLLRYDEGRIVDQISLYGAHRPGRNQLAGMASEYTAPGSALFSPLGQGVVSEDPRPASPFGAPQKVKWLRGTQARNHRSFTGAATGDPAVMRAAAARHQRSFRHWMRTFRGIAVHHIERYLAWYNHAWEPTPIPSSYPFY